MGTISTVSQQNPLVVVCGSDDNYAMPLAVTLYSALVHLERGCTIYIYIIDGGITHKSKERLQRVLDFEHIDVQLKWVTPPDLKSLSDLQTLEWITTAAYLRLLICDVIPEQFQKAIYLDSDLLVQANLKNLWEEDIGGYALLAVHDLGTPYVSSPFGIAKYRELGLASDTPYFNSGVLVINLKRWRAEKIGQSVIQYLREYDKYVQLVDQEGLNAVLANDWGSLDYKWNLISHIYYYDQWEESAFKEKIGAIREELICKPYIYHFAGGSKPWQVGCEHPQQLRWIRYLKESGWFTATESILWRFLWFIRYYFWQIKVLIKKIMIKILIPKSGTKFSYF
ncbi:MAG: glycosyltransferase family 8 protein [Iphinoe sp. HA4291-MV1]|jgi:lipopolysaccharide biosynthesis glycosyltransferase|nr:glycosyltransferase family 8 protein [Iphinoe sp. HA4291-MV1]